MRSLRIRLTIWFAASFLAVTLVFMQLCYQHLHVQLLRKTWAAEGIPPADWILKGSYSEQEIREIMRELVSATLIYSLPLVLVLLLLGYYLARKSLSPIDSLNEQLQVVGARNLGQRVHLPEADEQFRDLTHHLNDMLSRLQGSFSEMSEYAAKVAHELRTPLTIIRLKVEQSEGRIDPELAEEIEAELHRLTHVIDQSLLIAKAEQGRLLWQTSRVSLRELLSHLVDDFRLLAADQGRQITLAPGPDFKVETDPQYCKQILHVFLNNALVHGSGEIRVRMKYRRDRVSVIVSNRIKESFRSGGEHHLGLGLRVVRALVGSQPHLHFQVRKLGHAHATEFGFPTALPSRTASLRANPSDRRGDYSPAPATS